MLHIVLFRTSQAFLYVFVYNIIMKIFSERLKELRLEKNISKSYLAKNLSVSEPTVSRWESNQISPNVEKIVQIANFFDVTTDYLLGLSEYEK